MRSFVRMFGLPIFLEPYGSLEYSVRTGLSAAEKAMPGGLWRYIADHPEESRIFDEAMTGKAHAQVAGIVATYDFSACRVIGDIGGGRGHLLQAVLEKAPQATGVLFDLPHVTQQAAGKTSARLRLQAGDFFKDALPVCDTYMIMQVIHDWSDEEAVRILAAIRSAAPAGARLLLIETILPADANPSWVKLLDLHMMTLLTGRERTEREYRDMLAGVGFRLDRVIDVGMQTSIMEAAAV